MKVSLNMSFFRGEDMGWVDKAIEKGATFGNDEISTQKAPKKTPQW